MARRVLVPLVLLAAWLAAAQTAVAAGPTNAYVPTFQGMLMEGQQLSATQGVWVNATNAPSTFSYQWVRCSAGSCIPIPWAVESGYVPIRADVGSMLEVQVTATAAGGASTTVTSSAYGPVASDGATAYYVDGASTGGPCSDSYTTARAQSAGTPWCSITHAVSALATTSTAADIIVRYCDSCANGGTEAGYTGTQRGGDIDLSNDAPTGTVTIEPYGDASREADNVLVAGFWMQGTSNYNVDGFNLGDPNISGDRTGAGCPYVAQEDLLLGALPSGDYCLPATNIQMDAGTTSVALNDDNSVITVNTSTTDGPYCGPDHCPIGPVTLYGDRFHNPGYPCTIYKGMTTSAAIAANTPIASVPISPTPRTTIPGGASMTIPPGAYVSLVNGPVGDPVNYDQTGRATTSTPPGASSIGLSASFTPTHGYPVGTTVVVDACDGSAPALMLHGNTGSGLRTDATIQDWTVEHTQYDHSNYAAVALGANNVVFEYDTFDYLEAANTDISHADGFADEDINNLIYAHNLMYDVTQPWISLCNGTGAHTPCGGNFTIDNNVFTGCPTNVPCFQVTNSVGGVNYLVNNIFWSAKSGNVNGGVEFGWTDDCCTADPGQWYVENNIFDVLNAASAGTYGTAEQEIAKENYNWITAYAALPSGIGPNDIVGVAPAFATPIGSNCFGASYGDTDATYSGCTRGADGNFNAALLSGSPAIGAGTTGANISPTDLLGNIRTLPYDMGAFQFNVDSQPPTVVPSVLVPTTGTPPPSVMPSTGTPPPSVMPARNVVNPSGESLAQRSLALTVTSTRRSLRGLVIAVRCKVRCWLTAVGVAFVNRGRRGAYASRAVHLRLSIVRAKAGDLVKAKLSSLQRARLLRRAVVTIVLRLTGRAAGWRSASETVIVRLKPR